MAPQKERPQLVRQVGLPKSVSSKVAAIRRLTREIRRLEKHFLADSLHFRDRSSKLVFREKVKRRAEILEVLREENEGRYRSLIEEIQR